jgi:hypothetical protein
VGASTELTGNSCHLLPPRRRSVCTLAMSVLSLYSSWCTYGLVNQCSPPVVMNANKSTDTVTAAQHRHMQGAGTHMGQWSVRCNALHVLHPLWWATRALWLQSAKRIKLQYMLPLLVWGE